MTILDNFQATGFRPHFRRFCRPFCWRYLLIAVVLKAINFTAITAHAQQLDVNDFILSTKISSSCWPEGAILAEEPHLQLGTASLSRFDPSNPKLSSSQPSDRLVHVGGVIENRSGLETYDASRRHGGLSLFAEREPPSPQSFFSLFEARYVTWESNLADTRTLTYANGNFVYPLLQLNYAQSILPVTLYISPLLGTDAGR
jgi:hypothetical protein